jgi:hypothetical protein
LVIAVAFACHLDGRQILGTDIAGDVRAIEARGIEMAQRRFEVTNRRLECFEILIDQGIGTNFTADLLAGATGGNQFARVGMSMP